MQPNRKIQQISGALNGVFESRPGRLPAYPLAAQATPRGQAPAFASPDATGSQKPARSAPYRPLPGSRRSALADYVPAKSECLARVLLIVHGCPHFLDQDHRPRPRSASAAAGVPPLPPADTDCVARKFQGNSGERSRPARVVRAQAHPIKPGPCVRRSSATVWESGGDARACAWL